ncbi:MAG TPA: hypothetical protein VF756_02155 [Thermoanaerobaculia bacterium]
MRPYARRGKKVRINNRRKLNAGARRVSREFAPKDYPRFVVPLHLVLTRLRKARRQGLTKDRLRRYIEAMV